MPDDDRPAPEDAAPDDDRTTPEAGPPDDDGSVGTDPERARTTPEARPPGVYGPVGTDPEVARYIAEFEDARARYQAERETAEPDRKREALDALGRSLTRPRAEAPPKRTDTEPPPAPKPPPESKLPERLAAVQARVDADGEAPPDVEARIAEAEAEEADRRQLEATDRSAEHADPLPAAKTKAAGATDSGRRRRKRAARRGRREPKKPAQPERTPEERNAAARKRAAADPVAVLEYAAGAGWTWLDSQLNQWDELLFLDTDKSTDENAAAYQAAKESQTPEWRVFQVCYMILWKRQGDIDAERFMIVARRLVTHLAALPEVPGNEPGRSLLAALVEQMPTPAEWDTRRHKNLPGLLVNTRHVVPRPLSTDDQPHLPFDWNALTSEPPPNKPRYEVPAWLPGWEPPPSKLISSPIVDLWDSGPSCGRHGPCPVQVRLGWEMLLAPAPGDYIGGVADVRIKLGDLALGIWPNTGRYKRTVHGHQLRDAASWLNNPDNATRWSADAHAPPDNLVLWYRAPTAPYNPDQELVAYVTAPDGGRRRGAQIDNHQRRILAAISYRQDRVYMNACILWDRHATFHGYLVQLTVPEVNRNPAGYILGPDNKVATEKDGRPARRPTHDLAVHTGKRLANPAKDRAYPWLEGEDSILVANHRVAEKTRKRNMQRGYTIKTLIELRHPDKHRGTVLDFETRYRGAGVLSSVELEEMKEKEKRLPPNSELEAVRLLPTMAHFAAHEDRRTKAEQAKKAQRKG